jgi:hypothetical protein
MAFDRSYSVSGFSLAKRGSLARHPAPLWGDRRDLPVQFRSEHMIFNVQSLAIVRKMPCVVMRSSYQSSRMSPATLLATFPSTGKSNFLEIIILYRVG